ncbi:MAG: hypothetical protein ACFFAS_11985 [Promethearchaeota archaeon]
MENLTTDFYQKEKKEKLSEEEEESPELQEELILKTSSKEFKPSGLITQIEDEIKMAHLRKKYRKLS